MFCRYCGVDLPNDSLFCNKCGKPQQPENSTPATNIGVLVAPSRPGSPMSGGEVSAGNVPMAPGTPSVPGSAGIPPAANAGSSSPLSPRLLQESLHARDVPSPLETLYAPNTPKPLSKPHPSHEPHRA